MNTSAASGNAINIDLFDYSVWVGFLYSRLGGAVGSGVTKLLHDDYVIAHIEADVTRQNVWFCRPYVGWTALRGE